MRLGYRIMSAIGLGLIAWRPANGQRDANLDVIVTAPLTVGRTPPPLDGFLVCVGTEARRDLYGRQTTTAAGATRFIGLPRGNAVITLQKAGYAGNQSPVNLVGSVTNSATRVSVRMSPGSGPPSCPLVPVMTIPLPPPAPPSLDATPITDAPPSSGLNPVARPARLGEEILAWHGESGGKVWMKTLDCRNFGANFVMIGIDGKEGQAVDAIRLVCAPLMRDGTLGSGLRFTEMHGGIGGVVLLPPPVHCGPGEAVAAISGHNLTYEGTQLRRLTLHCRALNASGLGTGSLRPLRGVGSSGSNTAPWGPDPCTRDRPARALVVDKWPFRGDLHVQMVVDVVAAVQLICEQPIRGPF